MSRVLFVTWDGGGNVPPAVEIAHELQRRGHEVRFLGQEAQRSYLEAAGFEFAAYRNPGPWTATARVNALQEAVGFLRILVGRSLGRDLVDDVRAHPADLVVIDCLLFGAIDAASRARLPFAILVHSLLAAVETKMAKGAAGAVATITGVHPRKNWSAAQLVIVGTLKEIDLPSQLVSAPRYVGPILAEASGATSIAEPGSTPTILVSLSTTYIHGQIQALQNTIDAISGLPVKAIVTTGPAVDPDELRVSGNVEIHRFIAHAELMPAIAAVVGHGGHSTTMLALRHGTPLVILPMNPAFDQPLIGQRVEELGAGMALRSSARPAEIRAAVEQVLGESSYGREAGRLGALIRETHGAKTAADLIATLLPTTSVDQPAR